MLESRSPGVETWLLVGAVLLIIVTAFAAAFVPFVKCPGDHIVVTKFYYRKRDGGLPAGTVGEGALCDRCGGRRVTTLLRALTAQIAEATRESPPRSARRRCIADRSSSPSGKSCQ